MFKPLRDMARDPEGKVLVMSAMATVAVGTFVYSALEGWSLIDALYFSVVTLATVGFGDLTPTTDIAKLFTVGYIVTGIGILAAFATELAKHRGAPLVERIRTASSVEHEIVEETEELVGGPARSAEGDHASRSTYRVNPRHPGPSSRTSSLATRSRSSRRIAPDGPPVLDAAAAKRPPPMEGPKRPSDTKTVSRPEELDPDPLIAERALRPVPTPRSVSRPPCQPASRPSQT